MPERNRRIYLGGAFSVGHSSERHEIARPGNQSRPLPRTLPQKPRIHAGFECEIICSVGELRKTYKTVDTKSHRIYNVSREDHEMITTVPMHQLCRSAMRFVRLSKLRARNHFVTHITVFLWAGSRSRARAMPASPPNSRSAIQNPLTCRFIRGNVRWAQAISARC